MHNRWMRCIQKPQGSPVNKNFWPKARPSTPASLQSLVESVVNSKFTRVFFQSCLLVKIGFLRIGTLNHSVNGCQLQKKIKLQDGKKFIIKGKPLSHHMQYFYFLKRILINGAINKRGCRKRLTEIHCVISLDCSAQTLALDQSARVKCK